MIKPTVILGPIFAEPKVLRSPRWPAVRAAHLALHPFCAACGGTEHLQVHHKKPVHLFPQLELEPDNLITLCEGPGRGCHFIFGHLYSWFAFNPSVELDAHRMLGKVKRRQKAG